MKKKCTVKHWKLYIHFILIFKYNILNAWGWSVRPKHVAYFDGTNKVHWDWRHYVYQFLVSYITTGLLSTSLLSKNIKIQIFKIIILPLVLYGYETWSLTLRKERNLRALEIRLLRRIFGPRRDEVIGEWRKLHNTELNICTPHQVFGWSNREEWDGRGM